jgi:hypothetical protein
MKVIMVILLLGSSTLQASPEDGKLAAEKFLQDPKITPINTPNYQAGVNCINNMKYEMEPEKHAIWQQNQGIAPADLAKKGADQAMAEQVGEQIITADKVRPRFDEITDLKLIAIAEQFSENAKQELLADGTRGRAVTDPHVKYEIKICQHSRKPEEYQCIKYLQDPTVEVTPAKYSNFWCTSGKHRPDDPACQAKHYYPTPRMYQEKIVKVGPDRWVSECHALDARRRKNECKIIKEVCLDHKPHVINEETINRACWKYQYTYACKYPVQTSCESLLKLGCSPLGSKCIFTIKDQNQDKCYIWEQKYQCPAIANNRSTITKYVRPFCLEGECFNTDYAPNEEMLPSIAQLAIFAKMQQDVRVSMNNIFKGEQQGCNKLCLSTVDCCKISGWVIGLGLANCSSAEKQLAENRRKGLCVEVGTYCVEKVPLTGVCLRKKTNFCCFHSKLTKAIQEQGRRQLGMNFGSAEGPNCRGLTPEELTRIDFSKLNLSEAFADLQPKLTDQAKLQRRLQQNLKEIQTDFKKQMEGEK